MSPPKIGISANFMHRDPKRNLFKGKTLLFFEEGMVHWIMSGGGLPFLIPTPNQPFSFEQIVTELDGLVLHGGADVAPQSYGQEPLRPEWGGDAIRDAYEISLVNAFKAQGKPVLGICRGIQLLNVAFGGTLYQDIITQHPGALVHRDWEVYEDNTHEVEIYEGTLLHRLYGVNRASVNSVHHQAVRKVADSLEAEARSLPDGIVEAVRYTGDDAWIYGIQWHPEFQREKDVNLLDRGSVLAEFMAAVR